MTADEFARAVATLRCVLGTAGDGARVQVSTVANADCRAVYRIARAHGWEEGE